MSRTKVTVVNEISLKILWTLSGKESMRYAELRESLGIGDSTLSGRIPLLESHGFLKAEVQEGANGRKVIGYSLTDSGEAFVQRHRLSGFFA